MANNKVRHCAAGEQGYQNKHDRPASRRKRIALCALTAFLLGLPVVNAQGIRPAWGYEIDLALPRYDSYSGFEAGIYLLLGLEAYLSGTSALRVSAFGGGGPGAIGINEGTYWTYGLGGNAELTIGRLLLGAGYGLTGATLEAAGTNLSSFARGTIGFQTGGYGNKAAALKLHYDHNFNGGFRVGLLLSMFTPFSSRPAPPPRPAPSPRPARPAPPPRTMPEPRRHPTITPEELRRVELAYTETVRDIGRRGKRLYINNMTERRSFIQRYQGSPNTAQVNAARNTRLPWYDIRAISQEDIVRRARQEPNEFMKVRMIHDWVADVFAYDYDLLSWMRNVSGRNAEFTLGAMIARQRGVCFEYAILFWFLLDAVGLDVYLVSDSSQPGIGHAYNMVIINGTGYIIDTTWDSGNWYVNGRITQFDRMVSTDYFMPGVSQSYRLRDW